MPVPIVRGDRWSDTSLDGEGLAKASTVISKYVLHCTTATFPCTAGSSLPSDIQLPLISLPAGVRGWN
jgi:hypothetical protein